MDEKTLHRQICEYIKLQYRHIMFNTDMSGLKLSIGESVRAKKLRSNNGFPDIMILEPKLYGFGEIQTADDDKIHRCKLFHFCGLFLEVKKESPYKKNGELKKNDHLSEQNNVHIRLRAAGYMAQFVWSFDQAKKIIDNYIKL